MKNNSQTFIDIGQGLSMMVGLPKITSWKSSERPKNAKKGTFGFNTQTSSLEFWDGAAWWKASMNEK